MFRCPYKFIGAKIHLGMTVTVKNDISEQLSDLFNLSFTTGSFPNLLKTAKVISIKKILNQILQIIVQYLFCQTLISF